MVNVQETELLPSLLSNNEYGVQKVQDFAQVKHIQYEANWRICMVKCLAWKESVTGVICAYSRFNTHVRAEHYLNNVIGEFERIKSSDFRQKRHNDLRQHIAR